MKWTTIVKLGIEFEIYYIDPPSGVDIQLIKIGGVEVNALAKCAMLGAYTLEESFTETIEHNKILENERNN